ncbi:MAG TPA: PEP/pyruvate-binding domain-containing protein [Lachnospiraceae bacterium]|nr:PEP/pyruvate-binding domain-containing protein [Lachnospiraceae bacterium]
MINKTMLCNLYEMKREDAFAYGSKAANLATMIQNGVEVPRGFCISFPFFHEFLRYNQISYDSAQLPLHNKEIQNRILNGELSKEMKDTINDYAKAYHFDQGDCPFVVRSSCQCEDSNRSSMAGVFSSFTNLTDVKELETSIKKCYASMLSDWAINYMIESKQNLESLQMGIIVQEYIIGTQSGVMFTADTVEMDENMICINSVAGTCEEFVDSSKDSTFLRIDKRTGEYADMIKQDADQPILQNLIGKLYRIAGKLEAIFDDYLDIEWTYRHGVIVVLQARPITTFRSKAFHFEWGDKKDEERMWFRLYDKPLSPLLQDIVIIESYGASQGAYEAALRMEFYGDTMLQHGYCYGSEKELSEEEIRWNDHRYYKFLEVNRILEKEVFTDIVLPELQADVLGMKSYVGRELTRWEAYEFLIKAISYLKKCSERHDLAAKSADIIIKEFEEFCSKQGIDISKEDIFNLLYNQSLLSKERTILLHMAQIVNESEHLSKLFNECLFDHLLYCRLLRDDKASVLVKCMNEYSIAYGITGRTFDTDLQPTIYEVPSQLIKSIRCNLNIAKRCNYDISNHKTSAKREAIEEHILANLDKNQKEGFVRRLKEARKAFLAKDNHNFYMDRLPRGYLRLAIMNCAKVLQGDNLITENEDIYFLTLEEVKGLLKHQIDIMENVIKEVNQMNLLSGNRKDIRVDEIEEMVETKIKARKEKYHSQMRLMPPEILGKGFESNDTFHYGVSSEVSKSPIIELKGLSGLKSKVIGKVCLGIPDSIEEDIILVLPNAHSDVSHILNYVRGFLFEGGAPYDHLGIMAREMGIPTLYYVKDICKIIGNGDLIEIDGINGRVRILENGD